MKGIGIVGLGGISAIHRQAYELYGFDVVAGCDPDPTARERFIGPNSGVRAYENLDDLLADERVEIVDLAVPHHRPVRIPVVKQVVSHGLPVLIQKPLAMTYDDALEIAGLVEESGVTAMVNQNMCFAPGANEIARLLLDDGAIGSPFLAGLQLRYRFDPSLESWYGKDRRWWTAGLNVHHLSLLHLLFGPPETVFAVTGSDPNQPGVTYEGYANVALRYASGLSVMFASTGTYYGVNELPHLTENIWIQGPNGVLDWTIGEAITLSRRNGDSIDRQRTDLTGDWLPDAFGLVMAHLQQAIERHTRPLCTVADNLYVMATVEAVYQSADSGRSVRLADVMGDRYDSTYGSGWYHGFHDWEPPSTPRKMEPASA